MANNCNFSSIIIMGNEHHHRVLMTTDGGGSIAAHFITLVKCAKWIENSTDFQ